MNEEFIKARRCNSIRILGRTFICSSLWCWEWQSSWGGNSIRWNLSTSDYAGKWIYFLAEVKLSSCTQMQHRICTFVYEIPQFLAPLTIFLLRFTSNNICRVKVTTFFYLFNNT